MADEIHISKTRARAGTNEHIVRYVLAISLTLAVLTMGAVMIWGGTNTPETANGSATVSKSEPR